MKLSNGQLILILCMQDVDLNSQVHVYVYSVATDELYKSFKSAPIQMGYRSSVSQQCWCLSVYIYMFVFLAAKPQYTSCQVSQTVNRYPVTCFVYSWVERGLVQAENTITPRRLQPKMLNVDPIRTPGFPINAVFLTKQWLEINIISKCESYQLSLLIWSPNPGVSVMVSFNLTPFSSITEKKQCHN